MYLWCGKDWACFLAEDGPTVWCAWPHQGKLEKVADLKRLDLPNLGNTTPAGSITSISRHCPTEIY